MTWLSAPWRRAEANAAQPASPICGRSAWHVSVARRSAWRGVQRGVAFSVARRSAWRGGQRGGGGLCMRLCSLTSLPDSRTAVAIWQAPDTQASASVVMFASLSARSRQHTSSADTMVRLESANGSSCSGRTILRRASAKAAMAWHVLAARGRTESGTWLTMRCTSSRGSSSMIGARRSGLPERHPIGQAGIGRWPRFGHATTTTTTRPPTRQEPPQSRVCLP